MKTPCAVNLHNAVTVSQHRTAVRFHEHHRWPLILSAVASPVLWVLSLAPRIPGAAGVIMFVPLMLLELMGVVARCFALMIRLFANMVSGHTLVATLTLFVAMALQGFTQSRSIHVFYIAPLCIVMGVLENMLDLLVAGLQAYIFTFLTAIFIGLYAEPSH